jgi:hypothetical protein
MPWRLIIPNRKATCIDPPWKAKEINNWKHGIINSEQEECKEKTEEKAKKTTRWGSKINYLESWWSERKAGEWKIASVDITGWLGFRD